MCTALLVPIPSLIWKLEFECVIARAGSTGEQMVGKEGHTFMGKRKGPVAVEGGIKLEEGVAYDLQALVAHVLEAALGHDGFQKGQHIW